MKVLIVRVGRPISVMDVSESLIESGYLLIPTISEGTEDVLRGFGFGLPKPEVIALERMRFAIGPHARPVFIEQATNAAMGEQLKRQVEDWLVGHYDRAVEEWSS